MAKVIVLYKAFCFTSIELLQNLILVGNHVV